MSKCERVTIDDLIATLEVMKTNKVIDGSEHIILSSDEEGNSYSHMLKYDGCIELCSQGLVIYPSHDFVEVVGE